MEQTVHYKERRWSKYFWRHNFDLAVCKPHQFDPSAAKAVSQSEGVKLSEILLENATNASEYLEDVGRQYRMDLYDPTRDEILLGLFSRLSRLFALSCFDPNLWARDTAGIMLRCLADTAITFAYLVKHGSEDELRQFRKYGEGKEKLLMLHLRDTYPGKTSRGRNTLPKIWNTHYLSAASFPSAPSISQGRLVFRQLLMFTEFLWLSLHMRKFRGNA